MVTRQGLDGRFCLLALGTLLLEELYRYSLPRVPMPSSWVVVSLPGLGHLTRQFRCLLTPGAPQRQLDMSESLSIQPSLANTHPTLPTLPHVSHLNTGTLGSRS